MTEVQTPSLTLCELAETGLANAPSYSPFCTKVIAALKRAKLPYTSRRGAHPGVFKDLNPTGQVPVLLVGDEPVADSTAIIERIEALSDAPMAASLSEREQAEAYLWEDYADTTLSGFLVAARWADDANWPRTKEAYFSAAPAPIAALIAPRARKGVIEALKARDLWRAGPKACWARFERTLDHLATCAPAQGFWVSKSISAADLALFAMLSGLRTPLTPAQGALVEARAPLAAYLDRVQGEVGLS